MKSKRFKVKGKIRLSKYFQKFNKGEKVAVVRELAIPLSFPKRMEGKTGEIECQRGSSYVIKINDFDKEKKYIVAPAHLQRIKSGK